MKGYSEIHICVDRQTFDIISPKCIERNRRDTSKTVGKVYNVIDEKTYTPYRWHNFLAKRSHKKQFVEFICNQFFRLGCKLLGNSQILVINGGFREAGMPQMVMHGLNGNEFNLRTLYNNHIEGDTMVYLHAANCLYANTPIILFSTDTDILFIGLVITSRYPNRNFIVHYKESAGESKYVHLTKLLTLMSNSSDLCRLGSVELAEEIQALYVCSGCDYVSFVNHYSKKSFFDAYFDNISFISTDSSYSGMLSHTDANNWQLGFRAFCRLVGSVFIKKCASCFEYKMNFKKRPSPREIYDKVCEDNVGLNEEDILTEWLNQIRKFIMQTDQCGSEDFWLPSDDSLKLHFKRCCYVLQVWKQTDIGFIKYPNITDYGWAFVGEDLVFRWDSDSNFRKVEKYRKLWSSGCKCKSVTRPCNSRICRCRKSEKPCGPACTCADSCQNKASDPSVEGLLQAIHPDEEDDNDVDVLQPVPVEYLTDDESNYQSSDSSDVSEDEQ